MFPLSSPATHGLFVDWLVLAVVVASLCAFAAGVSDLWTGVRRSRSAAPDAVALTAYAALALVALAVVTAMAGAHGVPVAQAAFLAVTARGLVVAVRRFPRVRRWWQSARGEDVFRVAVWGAAGLWSLGFWIAVYRDQVALPALTDGITHTAYYLRILEAGVPTLGRVPIGWASLFGTEMFPFYPTGAHALVAVTSGFWGQWGVISHAGILKAWFTLGVAGMPWALFWFARRVVPSLPWWIGVALVLAATPGFRFPIEVAHEGGLSRLIAHLVMTPIYADVLAGGSARSRWWPAMGVVLGVAFLMHPSTFVVLAALLAYTAVFDAAAARSSRNRVAIPAATIASLAIGALAAFAMTAWNAGAAPPPKAMQTFSWPALAARLSGARTTLFVWEYGTSPMVEPLVLAGFVVMFVRRRALGLAWRVVLYPALMTGVAVAALAALLVPLPGFRLLGGAFYDEIPRIIEVMYESVGLCLVVLALGAWQIVAGHRVGGVRTWRARIASATAAMLVLSGAAHLYASRGWIGRHVSFWGGHYSTSRISRLQTLGRWIEQHTEPDAILFYAPFDHEIWEAWTGRRGVFMYGECHVKQTAAPCESRKALVTAGLASLHDVLEARGTTRSGAAGVEGAGAPAHFVIPSPQASCLAGIDRFGRPGYFLIPSTFAPTRVFPVCSDAIYMTTLDGYAVVRYRRPPAGPGPTS